MTFTSPSKPTDYIVYFGEDGCVTHEEEIEKVTASSQWPLKMTILLVDEDLDLNAKDKHRKRFEKVLKKEIEKRKRREEYKDHAYED